MLAVFVPALIGLVVLLVPRWRKVGAGFVLGLAIAGIVFGGVCGGMGLLQQSPSQYEQDQREYEQPPLPDGSGP